VDKILKKVVECFLMMLHAKFLLKLIDILQSYSKNEKVSFLKHNVQPYSYSTTSVLH